MKIITLKAYSLSFLADSFYIHFVFRVNNLVEQFLQDFCLDSRFKFYSHISFLM